MLQGFNSAKPHGLRRSTYEAEAWQTDALAAQQPSAVLKM
jgi:hypothetical protein